MRVIGANPYGESVGELPDGARRVLVAGVWHSEVDLEPMRACRVDSAADAHQAMSSQAVSEISEAFSHRPAQAYAVWKTPRGQPTNLTAPALRQIETSNTPDWRAFRMGVSKAMGERGLRLRQNGSLVPVPHWEQVLQAPGPGGLPLGVAIGLGSRAPLSYRRLDPEIPGDWKTPGTSFGKAAVMPSGLVAYWPAAQPALAQGWLSLSGTRVPAWWVFPDTASEAAAALPASHIHERHEIRQAGKLLAIAVFLSSPNQAPVRASVSLLRWAGEPPQIRPNVLPVEPDEHGRVPYRSLSRASAPEAVAPLRLEAAMHAALGRLAQKTPDIDAWVAQGLELEPDVMCERLTCEQVDAVAMARHRLEASAGLIIADDAGFGKGRMLASLALTGLAQGRTVVMVTENPGLFSDFYRDLLAVAGPGAPIPGVLHQDARLLDPAGNLVLRGSATLPEPSGMPPQILLTTYAQLSNDPRKEKSAWLFARMGSNSWCLLDESHNAAGEATVFEALSAVVEHATGVVFASATFARGEHNLGLYRRAMGMDQRNLARLRLALTGDDGLLRQVLVEELARAGALVRREHPTVPPPPPVWVPPSPGLLAAMAAFEGFWQGLFQACEAWEEAQGGRGSIAWLKLGSWLSRTVREFSMLAKVPALVDWIIARIAEDAKVVVAADLTMEAALKDGLGLSPGARKGKAAAPVQEEGEELPPEHLAGSGIFWRDRLRALLDLVVPPVEQSNTPASSPIRARMAEGRALAEASLASLPDWTLSPLDSLIQQLASNSIAAGELSGRSMGLALTDKGWQAQKRPALDRQAQVRAFNSGSTNAIVLTRAGSTGISLHAGKQFTDQRKRWLMELGIPADPVARVQFWGRVRRRDQVQEPGYASLSIDTSYERRLRAREERKRLRLASFIGHGRAFEPDEVGPEGEAIIAEWALDRPSSARRIGVHQPLEHIGDRVDRALVRALVLPEAERNSLIARLDRGLLLVGDRARQQRADAIDRPSRAVRSAHWSGPTGGSPRMGGWSVRLVERSYSPLPHAGSEAVVEALRQHRAGSMGTVDGAEALSLWQACWKQEAPGGYKDQRRIAVWNQVHALLPQLTLGAGLTMTNEETGQPALGLALGVLAPTVQPSSGGASLFAPSQVGVRVFLAGQTAPIVVPLSDLLADRFLRMKGGPALPEWFDVPPFPWVSCALEGDPVAAAQLGRRRNVGRLVMIMDETGQERTIWRFPAAMSWRQIMAQPRDLAGADQVRDFLRAWADERVWLALAPGQSAYLEQSQGGIWLVNSANAEAVIQEEWLTRPTRGRVGSPINGIDPAGAHVFRRLIKYRDFPRLLYGWEGQGFGWRVDAKFDAWLEQQSSSP